MLQLLAHGDKQEQVRECTVCVTLAIFCFQGSILSKLKLQLSGILTYAAQSESNLTLCSSSRSSTDICNGGHKYVVIGSGALKSVAFRGRLHAHVPPRGMFD